MGHAIGWPIGFHGYWDDRRGGNLIREHFGEESAGKGATSKVAADCHAIEYADARPERRKGALFFAVQSDAPGQSVETDDLNLRPVLRTLRK